ncbi:hypothetical protein EW146_g2916 [Bondarzewia mesenterica]|uniref:CFEM domain-containing protein n=1 Tax=Bondarzewia mesenterica TaxID=1095465 RepID=A0A4S4LZ56_9AGAM|nr:hypothetical protein EW146_g2916 [Bondarzewia mesenterica]
MRVYFVSLFLGAAFASTVSASNVLAPRQTGLNLPSCALPCLANANFGSCGSSDIKCLCSTPSFISSVTTCVESSCSSSDAQSALNAASSECASVGASGISSAVASVTAAVASSSAAHASSTSSASATTTTSSGALMNGANVLACAAAAALGVGILAL